jgi:hypothetical protein
MDAAIAERWTAALRSGQYTQGTHLLKQKYESGQDAHCCLGVLCELYLQEKNHDSQLESKFIPGHPFKGDSKGELYMFGTDHEIPPVTIQKWAGISKSGCEELAELNDSGESFDELAARISEYAERL